MSVISLVDREATVLFGSIRMSFNLCLLARTMSVCVCFFFSVGMAPVVENTQHRHYRAMKPSRTLLSPKGNALTGKNVAFSLFLGERDDFLWSIFELRSFCSHSCCSLMGVLMWIKAECVSPTTTKCGFILYFDW